MKKLEYAICHDKSCNNNSNGIYSSYFSDDIRIKLLNRLRNVCRKWILEQSSCRRFVFFLS